MLSSDVNGDGGITNEEFQLELKDRQHRSQDEINKLFDKYKDRNNVVTKQNFKRLAGTGYEPLNMVKLPLSESVQDPAAGYWGTAFQCPPKTIAVGARTKVLPYSSDADNTVLNGVEILCGTLAAGGNTNTGVVAGWEQGDMFQSAEGPDGSWSAAQICPEGQAIDGLRVRKLPYLSTQDNTGLTNVTFQCRSKTLLDFKELGFNVAEPKGAGMGRRPAPPASSSARCRPAWTPTAPTKWASPFSRSAVAEATLIAGSTVRRACARTPTRKSVRCVARPRRCGDFGISTIFRLFFF